eukprot:m.9790 g.9790  ORF g.9790 m.9790 type:complete len:720 (-) comp3595_c0_seq2:113-2272(-)
MEDFVRELFVSCTGSTDGQFGYPQLQQVLKSLGSPELSQQDLSDMMLRLDVDGDGVVSLDDFSAAMVDYLGAGNVSGDGTVEDDGDGGDGGGGEEDVAFADAARLHDQGAADTSLTEADGGHNSGDTPTPMKLANGYVGVDSGMQRPRLGSADAEASMHALLGSFSARAGLAVGEKDELLGAVQAFVDARLQMQHDALDGGVLGLSPGVRRQGDAAAMANARATLEDSVERRCDQLRAENAALGDEFARLERELQERDALRKRVAEAMADTQRAQVDLAQASVEVRRAQDSERAMQSQLEASRADCNRLGLRVKVLEEEAAFLKHEAARLEQERSAATDAAEALKREKDVLMQDFSSVHRELDDDRLKVAGQADLAEQLQADCDALQHRVVELEALLQAREQLVAEMQASLDDQTMLLQSLRTEESTEFHGSIMNEIEDLVKTQLQGGMGGMEGMMGMMGVAGSNGHGITDGSTGPYGGPAQDSSTNNMTVALLQKLLPRIQETSLNALNPSAPASPERNSLRVDTTEAASPDSGVGTAPMETQAKEEKLEDTLRLYVASTQMLAGAKLVTPVQAEQMDVAGLRKLHSTMRDLVSARSQRLIEALRERDRLRSELEFKQTVAVPLINLAKKSGTPLVTPNGIQVPTSPETPLLRMATANSERGSLSRSKEPNGSPAAGRKTAASSSRKKPFLSRLRLFTNDSPRRNGSESGPEGTEIKV